MHASPLNHLASPQAMSLDTRQKGSAIPHPDHGLEGK